MNTSVDQVDLKLQLLELQCTTVKTMLTKMPFLNLN